MGDEQIDWEALDRFVRGEGSADERRELERWVNADPSRLAAARAMRQIGSAPSQSPRWDADAAWERLKQRRIPLRGVSIGRLQPRRAERRSLSFIPALLATGLTAAALTWMLARGSVGMPAARPVALNQAREVLTAVGERTSLTLSDGSRIAVSAESRLTIPADIGRGGRREVWLDGEAFFSIVHDSTRPFAVHTVHGVAEDLGTEFVISTYPEVRGLQVAVREGLVALRAPGDTSYLVAAPSPVGATDTLSLLGPGDVARVSATGAVRVSRGQDVGALFAAAEGTLALRAVALRDAIPRLERWYAITVDVPNHKLLARRISGTFREEPAASALGTIAMALEVRAVWTGNRVTLVSDQQRGETQ